jgi:hypothetical protein
MDAHMIGILWLIGALLLGLLNCYFGYRLFLFTVAIIGFLMGASFGHLMGAWTGSWIVGLVAAIMLGLLAGWACVMAYYAFIFVFGAIGFALAASFITGLFYPDVPVLIPIVCGLIGGFLSLWLQRIIIIVATSTQGALASILAATALISGEGLRGYSTLFHRFFEGELSRTGGLWFYLGVFVWLILTASGLVIQLRRGKEMYRTQKQHVVEA